MSLNGKWSPGFNVSYMKWFWTINNQYNVLKQTEYENRYVIFIKLLNVKYVSTSVHFGVSPT